MEYCVFVCPFWEMKTIDGNRSQGGIFKIPSPLLLKKSGGDGLPLAWLRGLLLETATRRPQNDRDVSDAIDHLMKQYTSIAHCD